MQQVLSRPTVGSLPKAGAQSQRNGRTATTSATYGRTCGLSRAVSQRLKHRSSEASFGRKRTAAQASAQGQAAAGMTRAFTR